MEEYTSLDSSPSVLEKSWDMPPFVDVIVTKALSCPATHPESLIYDIWPGAKLYCSCPNPNDDLMNEKCVACGAKAST